MWSSGVCSSSGVAYLYQAEVAVLSLVPASGPPAGATNVSVVGVGLLAGSEAATAASAT